MALTLANYKTGMQDAMDLMVYDEFRMSSVLFDTLPFVAGATLGGADTWTYGYHRVTTQPTAAVRAVNTPYTAQEQITTKLCTT